MIVSILLHLIIFLLKFDTSYTNKYNSDGNYLILHLYVKKNISDNKANNHKKTDSVNIEDTITNKKTSNYNNESVSLNKIQEPSMPYLTEDPTVVVKITGHEDNKFYRYNEVDEIPQIVGSDDLRILESDIHQLNIILVFDIYINKIGKIDRFEIIESNVPDKETKKIIELFSKLKFTPGIKKGELVNFIKRIEIKNNDK